MIRTVVPGFLLAAVTACAQEPSGVVAEPTSASPPPGLVWVAIRDLNSIYDDDANPENRPPLIETPPEGMITPVELNEDGIQDWRVDYSRAEQPAWCGTGGCRQRLYVSTPDGLSQVFNAQALGLEIVSPGSVSVWIHHTYCPPSTEMGDCRIDFSLIGDRLSPDSDAGDYDPLTASAVDEDS